MSRNGGITGTAPGLAWLSVTTSGGNVQRLLVRVAQSNGVQRGDDAFVGGTSHTCSIAADGTGLCWGANGAAQLGNGTTTNRASPTAISGDLSLAMLTAAGNRACGLTVNGAV